MILWRNIENYPFYYPFYHFDSDPRFPPFLLYVRWKSGVTFVRRCFRDVLEATDHSKMVAFRLLQSSFVSLRISVLCRILYLLKLFY